MLLRPRGDGSQIAVFAALLCCVSSEASAQAFIPAPGQGTVSSSYQAVVTRGQHGVSGTWFANAPQLAELPNDRTETHALVWYVEYGLTNRIAVHSSLPSMQVRYEGPIPHTEGFDGQQLTHDGIDWVGPPDFLALHNGGSMNDEYGRNHDRLVRANSLNFGAGVAFELTPRIGVFATITKLAWGQNLPPPRSVTVGMNWNFQLRRSAPRPTPNVNRLAALQ
jgi:hypothetical protein